MLISRNILEFINPEVKKISNKRISEVLNILGLEIDEQKWIYDTQNYEKLVFAKIISLERIKDSNHLTLCTVVLWDKEVNKFNNDSKIKIICGANNVQLNTIVIVALEGQVLNNGLRIKKRVILGIPSSAMICSLEELGLKKNGYREGIFFIKEDSVTFAKLKKGVLKNPIDLFNDYYWDVSTIFNSHFLQNQFLLTNLVLWFHSSKYKKQIPFENAFSNNLKRFQGSFIKESNKFHIRVKNKEVKGKLFCLETKRIIELFTSLDLKILSSLIHLGYNLVNKIVDYINLFSYIFGQPLHIYNEDVMLEEGLSVCKAKKTIKVVDFFDRQLEIQKDDFVITREDGRIVSLPSIIGIKEFQSNEFSQHVFLEVLYIPSRFISVTTSRMNISTITSKMVEKYASYSTWLQTIQFFSKMKNPLSITNIIKIDNWWVKNNLNINERIAIELSKLLKLFNVFRAFKDKEILLKGNYHWIKDQSDFIHFCYQLILYFDFKWENKKLSLSNESSVYETRIDPIKNTLHLLGYTETTPYLLSSEENSGFFNFGIFSQNKRIKVANEINPNFRQMVFSLVTPLLDIIVKNKNYNEEEVHIYACENLPITLTTHSHRLAIVSYYKTPFLQKNFNYLYTTIKKILNSYDFEDIELKMLRDLIDKNHQSCLYKQVNLNNTQVIYIDKKPIVVFGEIHSFLLMKYKIHQGSTFFAEIDLERLKTLNKKKDTFKRLSRHPIIIKEMTFLFKNEENFNKILKLIKKSFKEIDDVWIDKIYIEEKGLSVSFKLLIFQEHTISSKELNTLFRSILNLLKKHYTNIELKGQISVF